VHISREEFAALARPYAGRRRRLDAEAFSAMIHAQLLLYSNRRLSRRQPANTLSQQRVLFNAVKMLSLRVAKIPAPGGPGPWPASGGGEGGVAKVFTEEELLGRLDGVDSLLARLQSELDDKFRAIEDGLDRLEQAADRRPAQPPLSPHRPPATREMSLASPHLAGSQSTLAHSADALRHARGLPPPSLASPPPRASLRGGSAASLRAPSSPRSILRTAQARAFAQWPALSPPPGGGGPPPAAAADAARRAGAVAGRGLREDPERRLFLAGVQHHAAGPILMTVDLHDLREVPAASGDEEEEDGGGGGGGGAVALL
jgi:hypothetical protein